MLKTGIHCSVTNNEYPFTKKREGLSICGLLLNFLSNSVYFSSTISMLSPQVMDYDGISKNITDVGFCETGKWMYTGGEDGTARIWDLRYADNEMWNFV